MTKEISTRESNQIETVKQLQRTRLSPQRIEELSVIAAQNVVDGFIAQDRLDFDAASLHFSVMLQTIFPEYDSERLLKAAGAYVSALLAQSKIKDDNSNFYSRVHHESWDFVRNELQRMCRFLDLPSSFGIETEEFWRYHAARDDRYVKHIIELHRVLLMRLTGSETNFRELAALYFSGLAFHDQHTLYALRRGREVMQLYFRILFDTMNGSLNP